MRVLVTGAAGFIGSNLIFALEKRGDTVLAMDDLSVGVTENLAGFKGTFIRGDIRLFSYESLGKVDAIFHSAAVTDTTVTDKKQMFSVNVEATSRILEYAKRTGCRKVVYASSAATYGKGDVPMRETQLPAPANLYGESKVEMDRLAMDFGKRNPEISVIGLRYFNVYGPGETHKKKASSMIYQLYRQIASGAKPRVFKWGEQFRDFIYVKDVIQANLKASQRQGTYLFNVGTGVPTTFNQVIETLNSILDYHAPTEYFDNPYSFYQEKTLADTLLARQLLGFEIEYASPKGIEDYVRTLQSKT